MWFGSDVPKCRDDQTVARLHPGWDSGAFFCSLPGRQSYGILIGLAEVIRSLVDCEENCPERDELLV
jgi:hypothetical protein